MTDRSGFAYTAALTDAIAAATGSIVTTSPEAFRYRGADLRGAVERSLYVAYASHEPLQRAFRGEAGPPAGGTWVADLTIAAVLGRLQPPARDGRALAARALFAGRAAADRVRPRATPAAGDPSGPAFFLLDHLKYVRFIAPVLRELRTPAVVAATEAGAGVDRPLDLFTPAPPQARAMGRALWSFPGLATALDRLLAVLGELRASRVVVIEGMSPLDEVAAQAARVLGLPAVVLQQGWSPLVHAGFRGLSETAMAVWGEGFADLLRPHNPGLRFAVTGSPVLEAAQSDGRLRASLDGRLAASFFLQPCSTWIEPEHLEAMYLLVTRTAAALPDTVVLVREHPGAPLETSVRERLAAAGNVRLVPAQDWSLREVLDAGDVAVSMYSTSLLEAAALGTPGIIFNPMGLPALEPDLAAYGAGIRTTTVEEAVGAIGRALRDDVELARLRDGTRAFGARYFAGADSDDAAARAARLIDETRP